MFPQRKLLYERGLDESVGTYATDYVITFQCALFILILLYLRYVKYGNSISKRNTYNKSFWAVMVVNFSVGIAALVGGLAHQFLGSVEPYNGPSDALHWVVLWRLAASLSGAVAMSLFVMSEYLLTSEGLWRPRRYLMYGYYTFAVLFSLALVIHSLVLISSETNPWTLTTTFVILFVAALWEMIVSLIVLYKRFRVPFSFLNNSYERREYSGEDNVESPAVTNQLKLQQQNSLEPLNNNEKIMKTRRWDLAMYSVGTGTLIIGGVIQLILARFFSCSNHIDPASQGCPLPNSFNHNSVFHLFQLLSLAGFSIGELFAICYANSITKESEMEA